MNLKNEQINAQSSFCQKQLIEQFIVCVVTENKAESTLNLLL